jgi:hypothetical protein
MARSPCGAAGPSSSGRPARMFPTASGPSVRPECRTTPRRIRLGEADDEVVRVELAVCPCHHVASAPLNPGTSG